MMKLHKVTFLLLLIGGLNWLLVGAAKWDIGMLLGGQTAIASRVIYVLVGLAAVLEIVTHKKNCKDCDKGKPMSSGGGSQQPAM